MDVATGGGGDVSPLPPVENSGGNFLLEIVIFEEKFLNIYRNFRFFSISKKGGQNPGRNQNLGVGGFDSPESAPQSESRIRPPSWNLSPSQDFVATPVQLTHQLQAGMRILSRSLGKWNISLIIGAGTTAILRSHFFSLHQNR